ncbi:L,D-transpeptidase family protein [Schaalia suimastitidis]|uniref:L,D-transpeptidase family protein n=1 Tax=Schaalia suimastitidis TaxID=121163 RepID=UPI0003FD2370|nr:L,D-transpeptidase family protein [Schaalia suimastitidis]
MSRTMSPHLDQDRLALILMNPTTIRRVKWGVGIAVSALLIGTGAAIAHTVYYADRALPGTVLLGENLSGQNRNQVATLLDQHLQTAALTIDVDGNTVEKSLEDLGITVDTEATLEAVFAPNAAWYTRFNWLKKPIAVVSSIDEASVEAVADELTSQFGVLPVEATVTPDAEGTFTITESSSGTAVNTQTLNGAVTDLAATLVPTTVTLPLDATEAALTTTEAQHIADQANELVSAEVTIQARDEVYAPSRVERAAWITVPTVDTESPTYDGERIKEWLTQAATESNVDPVQGRVLVNSRGDIVRVSKQKVDGYAVNNLDAVADALIASLNAKTTFEGTFEYTVTEAQSEQVLIAEGPASAIYPAVPGEKWIDINLSNNTTTAYVGQTIVQGPTPMVPGDPRTPTITGTYQVWLKVPSQTMRGLNFDGTEYETPGVPWILYFKGDYALHGAPWRTSFGWSGYGGSHGCVNMPVAAAQWLYNWADIGTTVVSHY